MWPWARGREGRLLKRREGTEGREVGKVDREKSTGGWEGREGRKKGRKERD